MDLHPRVEALHARFVDIDLEMRELAIYNPALKVEVLGFDLLDPDWLLGVLITPWFMNLTLLPVVPQAIEPQRYGKAQNFTLPCGERNFLYNGDPAVGLFWGHSLHSPMAEFRIQLQARQEANLRLLQAVTPPPTPAGDPVAGPQPRQVSRRALLRGLPG